MSGRITIRIATATPTILLSWMIRRMRMGMSWAAASGGRVVLGALLRAISLKWMLRGGRR